MRAKPPTATAIHYAACNIVSQAREYDKKGDRLNRDRCLREAASAFGRVGYTKLKERCERFIGTDVAEGL